MEDTEAELEPEADVEAEETEAEMELEDSCTFPSRTEATTEEKTRWRSPETQIPLSWWDAGRGMKSLALPRIHLGASEEQYQISQG